MNKRNGALTIIGEVIPEKDEVKLVCPNCHGTNTEIEDKGNEIGFYCCDCGNWVKWNNKEDERSYEDHKNEVFLGDIMEYTLFLLSNKESVLTSFFHSKHTISDDAKREIVRDLIKAYRKSKE